MLPELVVTEEPTREAGVRPPLHRMGQRARRRRNETRIAFESWCESSSLSGSSLLATPVLLRAWALVRGWFQCLRRRGLQCAAQHSEIHVDSISFTQSRVQRPPHCNARVPAPRSFHRYSRSARSPCGLLEVVLLGEIGRSATCVWPYRRAAGRSTIHVKLHYLLFPFWEEYTIPESTTMRAPCL